MNKGNCRNKQKSKTLNCPKLDVCNEQLMIAGNSKCWIISNIDIRYGEHIRFLSVDF